MIPFESTTNLALQIVIVAQWWDVKYQFIKKLTFLNRKLTRPPCEKHVKMIFFNLCMN